MVSWLSGVLGVRSTAYARKPFKAFCERTCTCRMQGVLCAAPAPSSKFTIPAPAVFSSSRTCQPCAGQARARGRARRASSCVQDMAPAPVYARWLCVSFGSEWLTQSFEILARDTQSLKSATGFLPTLRERLSQARDGFQTTAPEVAAASFTGEGVHLQIHSLAQFRTCSEQYCRELI